DEDWFQVDMGPSTYEDLLVAMRNDTGVDIKLEVFDPTGTFPLASTPFDGRNGLDDFVVVPHGKHFSPTKLFRVTTTNGTGNYQLFFGYGVPNTVLCKNSNLAIPDNDPAGAESTQNIGQSGIIGDLDVRVRLTHPDTGELTIELEHVDTGSMAVLYQGACPGNIDMHLTFDDEDPFGISCPLGAGDRLTPATTDALSVFDGENVNGDWTLRVIDATAGNVGTIDDWCLELTQPQALPAPRMFDCSAGYGSEPNVAIPDAPSATEDGVVTDDIVITDLGAVTDMNVFVWIEHPHIGD
ncbi:MAG: proprotein convertase P-domain-containing protein, partial [Candidatus Omnitrophica bacterium]|nr:proprotein convertase P-domain-containing protein [Candidatus Omnitrophota bacterium]